jgi:hypothetical protein
MRRFGPTLIATVAILTARADAQVHDSPLFAAFKAFCGREPGRSEVGC